MGNIYNPVTLIGKVNFSERYTGLLEYPKQAPQVSREMTARGQSYIHLSVIPPFRTALHEDLLTTLTLHTPHSPKPCNAVRGWLSHTDTTLLQEVKTLNQSEIDYVLEIIPEDPGGTEPNSTLITEGLSDISNTLFTKEHQKAKKPWGSWKEK